MESMTQVIERRHTNGTVTVTITKETRKKDSRYKLELHEENYSTNEHGRSMYNDKFHTLFFYRDELLDLRLYLEQALLFLESK